MLQLSQISTTCKLLDSVHTVIITSVNLNKVKLYTLKLLNPFPICVQRAEISNMKNKAKPVMLPLVKVLENVRLAFCIKIVHRMINTSLQLVTV